MIKLYCDENIPEAVAIALRLRGHDVLTVKEAAKRSLSDIDQINHASLENRTIFTFNVADFYKIHSAVISKGAEHSGIILSKQLPIGTIVKALSRLLSNLRHKEIKNNVVWLSDWIK